MTTPNSDSARNVTKYTGQNYNFAPAYVRTRDPTTNDLRDPKNQGYYPFTALWINKTNNNLWSLVSVASNLATWILLTSGSSGPLLMLNVPSGTSPIVPDSLGNITFTSSGSTVTITGSSASPNNHTVNFDVVGGAIGTTQFNTDVGGSATPLAGVLTTTGGQVATGTVGANVIQTNATAAHTLAVQIQRSTAVAATDSTKNGVSHFSTGEFTVDANGFVQLIGGAAAISKLQGDDPGNPVVPSSGIVTLLGSTVANATNSKPVFFKKNAASTEELDIQVATTSTSGAKSINKAGLASFDSAAFNVDAATGFISLVGGSSPAIESITTDDGSVVVPALGTINMSSSGSQTIRTIGTTPNTVKPIVSFTNKTFLYGKGLGTEASTIGPLTNGQLIIGSTAGDSAAATLTAGSNIVITNAANSITIATAAEQGATNLGISYSASTFTIKAADGTSLSGSNPAYVTMPSTTAGQQKTFTVTANQSFIDSTGASQIVGNTFGTTGGVAWATDMPFYIYAVQKSTNDAVTFMIARIPNMSTSPAAGKIAKSGSAVASSQGGMFALDSTITVANYASQTCLLLGSFKMQKTAGDDWSVSALVASQDGMNLFQDEIGFFTYPTLQNGATSNIFFSSVGGDTIPTFTSPAVGYRLYRNGVCEMGWGANAISVNGVGAGSLQFTVPLAIGFASTRNILPGGIQYLNSGASTFSNAGCFCQTNAGATTASFYIQPYGTGVALLTPAGWTTDKQNLSIFVKYPVSTT
jgi:hypothetical protein